MTFYKFASKTWPLWILGMLIVTPWIVVRGLKEMSK